MISAIFLTGVVAALCLFCWPFIWWLTKFAFYIGLLGLIIWIVGALIMGAVLV